MMRQALVILMLLVVLVNPSCSQVTLDDQYNCFKQDLEKVKTTFEYLNVMQCFRDTLNNWLCKDIKGVRYLRQWKHEISDAVFFNSDKTKALLLCSAIDPDSSATFDNVQIIGAEKIDNAWHFYIQSYPNVGFNRDELSPRRMFNSTEMLDYVIKDLIRDGYYYTGKCEIKYSYIDSDIWFADWMRQKHQEFLQNKW